MNLDALQQKLIAAARANPPGDTVPYAFERRIMARLADLPLEDAVGQWGRALWRAAAACLAVSAVIAAVFFTSFSGKADLSGTDFESTVVAAAAQLSDSW
jgi:anti-sigma-K factor RskA